jgi:hypothetical protein
VTTEQRIERAENNVHRLAVVQDEMMDLLGLTVEGERRLATQMEEHVQTMKKIDAILDKSAVTHAEMDEKLNALIGVVDGFIRGKS